MQFNYYQNIQAKHTFVEYHFKTNFKFTKTESTAIRIIFSLTITFENSSLYSNKLSLTTLNGLRLHFIKKIDLILLKTMIGL